METETMQFELARPEMILQHTQKKYQGICPIDGCGWKFFKWTEEQALAELDRHLHTHRKIEEIMAARNADKAA